MITDISALAGKKVRTTIPRRNREGDFYPVGYIFEASLVGKKLRLQPLPCPECGQTGSPILTNDFLTLQIVQDTAAQGDFFDYAACMKDECSAWPITASREKITENRQKHELGLITEFCADSVGTYAELKQDVATKGAYVIPKGSRVMIDYFGKGFDIVSDPCPHCGIRHGVLSVAKKLMKLA
jgi:hypothetical protein